MLPFEMELYGQLHREVLALEAEHERLAALVPRHVRPRAGLRRRFAATLRALALRLDRAQPEFVVDG